MRTQTLFLLLYCFYDIAYVTFIPWSIGVLYYYLISGLTLSAVFPILNMVLVVPVVQFLAHAAHILPRCNTAPNGIWNTSTFTRLRWLIVLLLFELSSSLPGVSVGSNWPGKANHNHPDTAFHPLLAACIRSVGL